MFINVKKKITIPADPFDETTKIEYEWKIEKETEKAFLIDETVTLIFDEGKPAISKTKEWIPKSAVKVLSNGWIAVASWIPRAKELHPINIVLLPPEFRPEEYKKLGTEEHPMTPEKYVEMYQQGLAKLEAIPVHILRP